MVVSVYKSRIANHIRAVDNTLCTDIKVDTDALDFSIFYKNINTLINGIGLSHETAELTFLSNSVIESPYSAEKSPALARGIFSVNLSVFSEVCKSQCIWRLVFSLLSEGSENKHDNCNNIREHIEKLQSLTGQSRNVKISPEQ